MDIKNRLKISIRRITIRGLENSTGILQDFRNGGGLWKKVGKNSRKIRSWW